jgi:hypothetical protein
MGEILARFFKGSNCLKAKLGFMLRILLLHDLIEGQFWLTDDFWVVSLTRT